MRRGLMSGRTEPTVAIVDYGMGNLFSIENACENAGLSAAVTSDPEKIACSHALILPGVGAFGDAMTHLKELDLIKPIRETALSGKPFLGICLGMQLLLSRSFEFGEYRGLDIIKGDVVKFEGPVDEMARKLKVPQVGWNHVFPWGKTRWEGTLLDGVTEGEFMYFVHSYYVKPDENDVVLSVSKYGDIQFCSSLAHNNIWACQFHPERSGKKGMKLYENFAQYIKEKE
jgi:imidazole glycerol-phosphate synthase subunit HisH